MSEKYVLTGQKEKSKVKNKAHVRCKINYVWFGQKLRECVLIKQKKKTSEDENNDIERGYYTE